MIQEIYRAIRDGHNSIGAFAQRKHNTVTLEMPDGLVTIRFDIHFENQPTNEVIKKNSLFEIIVQKLMKLWYNIIEDKELP